MSNHGRPENSLKSESPASDKAASNDDSILTAAERKLLHEANEGAPLSEYPTVRRLGVRSFETNDGNKIILKAGVVKEETIEENTKRVAGTSKQSDTSVPQIDHKHDKQGKLTHFEIHAKFKTK